MFGVLYQCTHCWNATQRNVIVTIMITQLIQKKYNTNRLPIMIFDTPTNK